MINAITLNNDEYSALCSLVDYLHDDELKHYEEAKEEGEHNKHYHNLHHINVL